MNYLWRHFKKHIQFLLIYNILKIKSFIHLKWPDAIIHFIKKYKDSMDPQSLMLFKDASSQIYNMLEKYIANNEHELKRPEIKEAKSGLYEIINDNVAFEL